MHYRDALYFLRANNDLHHAPFAKVYDVDSEFCTSHDHLVSSWIAQTKYFQFAKRRLEQLKDEVTFK
jgi:hypothetical protein